MTTFELQLESLNKEIKYVSEITSWIKKYTELQEENTRYIKFFIEYLDMIPDHEARRLILLMDEFGISSRNEKK